MQKLVLVIPPILIPLVTLLPLVFAFPLAVLFGEIESALFTLIPALILMIVPIAIMGVIFAALTSIVFLVHRRLIRRITVDFLEDLASPGFGESHQLGP